MTESELRNTVIDLSDRKDLKTTQINAAIRTFEGRLAFDLRSEALEELTTVAVAANASTLTLPNLIELQSVSVGGREVLRTSRADLLERQRTNRHEERTWFVQTGRTLEVWPVSTSATVYTLKARLKPQSIFDGGNWISDDFPNVYTFGTLIEIANLVRDKEDEARWQGKYNEALTQLNTAFTYTGATVEMRPASVK